MKQISIADGKKEFTRWVKETEDFGEEIVFTKRKKPVAALLSVKEYLLLKRVKSYIKMKELSKELAAVPVSAQEIVELHKKEHKEQ